MSITDKDKIPHEITTIAHNHNLCDILCPLTLWKEQKHHVTDSFPRTGRSAIEATWRAAEGMKGFDTHSVYRSEELTW